MLLRTLRFPEIRKCEMTDEQGWVISSITPFHGKANTKQERRFRKHYCVFKWLKRTLCVTMNKTWGFETENIKQCNIT